MPHHSRESGRVPVWCRPDGGRTRSPDGDTFGGITPGIGSQLTRLTSRVTVLSVSDRLPIVDPSRAAVRRIRCSLLRFVDVEDDFHLSLESVEFAQSELEARDLCARGRTLKERILGDADPLANDRIHGEVRRREQLL